MPDKKVIIIAGPNGAGKTTFALEYLPNEADCPAFVNADLIAVGLSPVRPATAAIRAGRLLPSAYTWADTESRKTSYVAVSMRACEISMRRTAIALTTGKNSITVVTYLFWKAKEVTADEKEQVQSPGIQFGRPRHESGSSRSFPCCSTCPPYRPPGRHRRCCHAGWKSRGN